MLLIRLAVGLAAIGHGLGLVHGGIPVATVFVVGLHFAVGLLILFGLWTPVVGTLLALLALADAYQQPKFHGYCIVVGTVGIALALIGPGMWSVDARLFGWKRVEISNGKRREPPP